MLRQGDKHYADAQRLFREGDYAGAVNAFHKAAKRGVKQVPMANVYTSLGVCYGKLGLFDDAFRYHQKALDLDPDYVDALKNLGIVYRLTNDLDKAEAYYRKALALAPNDDATLGSLGVLYIFRDEPLQAITMLERAVERNNQSGLHYGNLALAYGMVERFTEADEALKRSISLGYDNWETINQRVEGLRTLAEQAAAQHDVTWLPAVCPRCGAPTTPTRVKWTGPNSAACGSCGVNLPH